VLTSLLLDGDRLDAERQLVAAAVEASRTAAGEISERLHGLELQAGEARHQRARIVERIRDEYDIEIDAATHSTPAAPEGDGDEEPIPDDRADLEARIEELRRKIGSMTSVNLEALQEAEELAERLAKLEAQLADVTGGKESIEQLIARIDEESRRLLGETIETVRGYFRDLFERVFGGGQADIVLEEGVDLLEAAVEIVARPPGKEPRSISLLSGGEKTMTCVALLLAIFKSRPSPFCVLDEVDAALDEANVDRFVSVLRHDALRRHHGGVGGLQAGERAVRIDRGGHPPLRASGLRAKRLHAVEFQWFAPCPARSAQAGRVMPPARP
jgi:chromosome segregation protein